MCSAVYVNQDTATGSGAYNEVGSAYVAKTQQGNTEYKTASLQLCFSAPEVDEPNSENKDFEFIFVKDDENIHLSYERLDSVGGSHPLYDCTLNIYKPVMDNSFQVIE